MNSKRQVVLSEGSADTAKCVLYVMSRDQRVRDNHALLAAQAEANELKLPLVVCFALYAKTGVRSREHFEFMVAGLKDVERSLSEHSIAFVIRLGSAQDVVEGLAKELTPSTIYFDFNPLRGPRKVQKLIAGNVSAKCIVVDTHNSIPLWVLSDKEEFAAHTIRRKVHKNLANWIVEPGTITNHEFVLSHVPESAIWEEVDEGVSLVESSGIVPVCTPGEKAAESELQNFIQKRLATYASERNVPTIDGQSNLSPYLHFGHISALRVALALRVEADDVPLLFKEGKLAKYEGEPTKLDSINALLEELIVRKELADNYCFYNVNYDNLNGAKDWAIKSLNEHKLDKREYYYSRDDWEKAETHDTAWNAAQMEMMTTGKMHGYMRMYWAKKVLEWSESPEEAIATAVYLNDKYSIDGGDPNGYTGIMWSIAGIHDRPWFERDVYGKIRYMNRGGLERRFDVEEYISTWAR